MIQLNLLPDIKLSYIKAQRQRRLVLTVSVLVTIGAVAILLLLLSVNVLQKKHMSDLSKDITKENSQLQNKPDINKILTVQNQLKSLTALHDSKPAAGRLFEYLNETTPASVNITTFNIDFTQNLVTITGTSDTLSDVNKYVDTLKAVTFTTSDNSTPQPAFKDVVLSSFGLNGGAKDTSQAASFNVTLSYNPTIFDITQKVDLTVPNAVTTRSEVNQPSDLFKPTPTAPTAGGSR